MKKFLLLILALNLNNFINGIELNDLNNSQNEHKEPKKISDIKEILNISLKNLNHLESVLENITQQFTTPSNNPKIDEELKRAQKEFYSSFFDNLKSSELNEKMIKLYDDVFTSEEITELLKFYQSDLGKKILEKLPEITLKSSEFMSEVLQEHATIFVKKVEQIQKNLNN